MAERSANCYYVSGFQVHQARKVCEFFFGDYFVDIELIKKERVFHITIKKTLSIAGKETPVGEFLDLKDFQDYWTANWKLLYEPTPEVVKV